MKRIGRLLGLFIVSCSFGCSSLRTPQPAPAGSFSVVTYNVNRGSDPGKIAEVVRDLDAGIVCLQEAHQFERKLTTELSVQYPTVILRDSDTRAGGEYAVLSKYPAQEVAWIDSETGWFGAWIMKFETPAGLVQVMNVHLRPPFKGRGKMAVVRGYFFTSNDRLREMECFYSRVDPNLPLLVVGDFNDTEQSRAVRFLTRKGFKNALRKFDRSTPTWRWPTRTVTLRRRLDHIFYSPELDCTSARVHRVGPSDHFPVEAVISRKQPSP